MWSGQSLLQFDRQAITGCHLMGRWRKGRQYDVLQLLDLCATLVPSKVQTIEGMFSWHICSQYRDPRDQFCYWCVCVCFRACVPACSWLFLEKPKNVQCMCCMSKSFCILFACSYLKYLCKISNNCIEFFLGSPQTIAMAGKVTCVNTTSAFKPNVVRLNCKRYAAALGSTAFS